MKLSDLPSLRAKAKKRGKLPGFALPKGSGVSNRGNKRVEIDGLKFMSRAESRRYLQLKTLQAAGKVVEFNCQVRLPLNVNGAKVCTYIPDFQVWRDKGGCIFEDVKGFCEDDAKIKIALARALGYDVRLLTTETNPELWKKG